MKNASYYTERQAEDAMAVIASWLGKRGNLRVNYHGGTAVSADIFSGKINIPRLACASGLTQEALMLLRSRVYHEAGHIDKTEFSKSEYPPPGVLFEIWNAIEDRWMEAAEAREHKGCEMVFRWSNEHHNKKIAQKINEGHQPKALWEALVAMSLMSDGFQPAWTLSEKAQAYVDAAYDEFMKVRKVRSSKGALQLANRIYKILKDAHKEYQKEHPEQKQQQKQQQEQEQQEQQQGGEQEQQEQEGGSQGQTDFEDEEEQEEQEQSGASGSSGDEDEDESEEEGDGSESDGDEEEDGDEDESEGSSGGDSDEDGDEEDESEDESEGSSGDDFDDEEEEDESESGGSSGGDEEEDEDESEGDEDGSDEDGDEDADSSSEGDDKDDFENEASQSESEIEGDDDSDSNSRSDDNAEDKQDYEPQNREKDDPEESAEEDELSDEEIEREMEKECEGISKEEIENEELEDYFKGLSPRDTEYLSRRDLDQHNTPRTSDADRRTYKERRDMVAVMVAAMTRSLEQALRSLARCRKKPLMRHGKIDKRRLVQIAKNLSKEVFYKTQDGMTLDVAVEIILDESGSMSSSWFETQLLALAIGEALTAIKVPFEMTGTTTVSHNVPLDGFTRTKPIVYNHYKTFGESWHNVRYRIVHSSHHNNNIDGEAVEYCAFRLAQRPERRKIIFSLSDGRPYGGQGREAELAENIVRVCKRCRESGIEVYGFGIATTEPKQYYGSEYFVYLKDPTEMGPQFVRTFARIVTGGMIRV